MTRYPKSGKGSPWTNKELQAIAIDWKGDTLSDGRGLSGEVRVASTGDVSVKFKFQFKWQGKVCWFYCGTWPTSSLAEIRQSRDSAREQVKGGVNPIAGRQADRIQAQNKVREIIEAEAQAKIAALTVSDLFDAWIKGGVTRSDGNAEILRSFTKDVLPSLGAKLVSEVTEQHIGHLLRTVVSRGCNRLAVAILTDVRQMFLWAEKRKPWRRLLIDGNPAILVNIETIVDPDYDLSNERDRVLSEKEICELANIFTRMQKEYESAVDRRKAHRPVEKKTQLAIWISLSTTCRIGELLMAEWSHINWKKREWFIPIENTKGLRKKSSHKPFFCRTLRYVSLKNLRS